MPEPLEPALSERRRGGGGQARLSLSGQKFRLNISPAQIIYPKSGWKISLLNLIKFTLKKEWNQ
jgi:hypothetical protein